jgi:hypothetical protein
VKKVEGLIWLENVFRVLLFTKTLGTQFILKLQLFDKDLAAACKAGLNYVSRFLRARRIRKRFCRRR